MKHTLLMATLTTTLFASTFPLMTRAAESEFEQQITEAMPTSPVVKPKKERKILVYSKASGFHHQSIPTGKDCFRIMSEKTKAFSVTFSDDVADYSAENLKNYDAILFNNTTKIQKAFTTPEQQQAILDFINNGGGYIGIHSASDAGMPEWNEYTDMVGGCFNGHPWGAGGTWGIRIEDPDHPIMECFEGKDFMLKDELYKYKGYDRSKQRVLASIDVRVSPKGKAERPDRDHALIWVRNQGKGRVFFSALGHNHEVFFHPQILECWLAGIQFALGDLQASTDSLPLPAWPENKESK
jgi:type 1 glutamine amidotransferase